MPRIYITYPAVARAAGINQHWAVRLEYTGANPNNATGISHKYWEARGKGWRNVTVVQGRIGTSPPIKVLTYAQFGKECIAKLAEGYKYSQGPSTMQTPPVSPAACPTGVITQVDPKKDGFHALDVTGAFVMMLTAKGARDLVHGDPNVTIKMG